MAVEIASSGASRRGMPPAGRREEGHRDSSSAVPETKECDTGLFSSSRSSWAPYLRLLGSRRCRGRPGNMQSARSLRSRFLRSSSCGGGARPENLVRRSARCRNSPRFRQGGAQSGRSSPDAAGIGLTARSPRRSSRVCGAAPPPTNTSFELGALAIERVA
jgi:hypothetical protein